MQTEKKEKCIIIGPSGSGKDFLMRGLIKLGLKPCLKWTTRPIRKFEKQGISYNFVTEGDFTKSINENKFLTYQTFTVTPEGRNPETWYYGITESDFQNSQVIIMTPGEFSKISPDMRKSCFVVYLDIDRSVRESRLSNRLDKNDSIKRRLDSDEEDFADFSDYDLKITDPDFEAEDVYHLMD